MKCKKENNLLLAIIKKTVKEEQSTVAPVRPRKDWGVAET